MKYIFILAIYLLFYQGICAQEAPSNFTNPVLPGFHPDPSICRVGDDYFLVNSSFNWFPGIPIFQSKDLVNWKPIGHVLDRPSQLKMKTPKNGGGIWAPTIRYHDGLYYVIVTCKQCENNCNCGHNFYVTATQAQGPYSDPVYIEDAPGIDPTIFWDDDGKVYYVGSTHKIGGPRQWPAEDRIYIAPIDLQSGRLIDEPTILTSGHASNAKYAEGPHIYKVKDKYLLLIAEGGTWTDHAITGFIADRVMGPYQPLHVNPLLTHRHLGRDAQVTTLGHADLVQTQYGDWWAVLLGCRPIDGKHYTGRETFLCPVQFQGYTPVFNPGIGQVLLEDQRPNLSWTPYEQTYIDEFDGDCLDYEWNFLRTPEEKWYTVANGNLYVNVRPQALLNVNNPSLIARRIEHRQLNVESSFQVNLKHGEEAGIILLQSIDYHYRFVIKCTDNKQTLQLIKQYKHHKKDHDIITECIEDLVISGDKFVLGADLNHMKLDFYYMNSHGHKVIVAKDQSADILTSAVAGGFIGAYVGMYTSSNGKTSDTVVQFDHFKYKPN